ncbi:MAG: Bax inhibitor-1 family protein, partial [Gammaproteobacteria bacterium]|nr:Bax inhibitor-1 family protein [Gammaproteobacteria bacterium]
MRDIDYRGTEVAQPNLISARTRTPTAVQVNSVLRNTYLLLGMTLAFSAATALVSMAMNAPYPGFLITIIGFFGLLYAVHKTADSALGIVFAFLFTGFLGFTTGPILNAYLSLANGPNLVASALGTTAAAF